MSALETVTELPEDSLLVEPIDVELDDASSPAADDAPVEEPVLEELSLPLVSESVVDPPEPEGAAGVSAAATAGAATDMNAADVPKARSGERGTGGRYRTIVR